ncbi:hypothetical protein [Bacteroides heparinolyticus]|uniref:hypothetical protein n=1 Tax=Prevotella heparinolytica TaxID=28113 RepID=UPI00359F69C2
MKKKEATAINETVGEFLQIRSITEECFLELTNNKCLVFIKIDGVNLDLMSENEKIRTTERITSELSAMNFGFKFLAISRPVDLSMITERLVDKYRSVNGIKKVLLKKELSYINESAAEGSINERQFFISICDDRKNRDILLRNAELLTEKFASAGIRTKILKNAEIATFINLVNNPVYAGMEPGEYSATVPTLIC